MIDQAHTMVREIVRIGLEMAPFVALGLVAAVIVYAVFPSDKIEQWLGRPGLASTTKAAVAGIPLPLCSCGVIPTALSLRQRGASDGATVSFLVSTPETGVDSIAVTYALINPLMTVIRPVAAFISAVATGLAVDLLRRRPSTATSAPEHCVVCGGHDCAEGHSWRSRLAGSARYVLNDFFPDIANWLVLGLVVSGILAALLPSDLFAGSSWAGQMAMAVLIGVPLYICASASTPLAAVLLAKGMSPGAALVFMLVGPATNAASLILIARALGRRTAAVYLLGVIACSVVIGLAVNALPGSWNWTPRIANPRMGDEISLFHWIGGVLLASALIRVWVRQFTSWQRRRRRTIPLPTEA